MNMKLIWAKKKFVLISLGCLLISVLSLFAPIVSYETASGQRLRYSLLTFINTPYSFEERVLGDYTGTVWWDIDTGIILVLVVLGIFALLCAIVGLLLMSRQRANVVPFILTLIGLVGSMTPAVFIFAGVYLSRDWFNGTMSSGLYPIITPLAMIVSIVTATAQYRANIRAAREMRKAGGLIRRAGSLD